MSIVTQFAYIAVRYVAGTGGGRAVDFLVERFADQSQRLPKALASATERAWKTLELTLAGDSLWGKLTTRAEDQALARELRLGLVVADYDGAIGNKNEFFRSCLQELRAVRRSPSPPVQPDELIRHRRAMDNYADPVASVEAEWHAAEAMADECERSGNENLARFLRLRSGELPFLTVALRYYFRRAIEEDRELFQEMAFAKLEVASTVQEQKFASLAETLDRNAARLESVLSDVLLVAEDARQGVLRIEDEMGRQGEEGRAFYLAVIQRLDRLEMRGGEVRSSDGMSIRSDDERQKVRDFLRQYRAMPDEARRDRPALLDAVAKLEFAAGDYEQARADFSLLPTLLDDSSQKAQAHFNAYRAALERAGCSGNAEDWRTALLELIEAVELDKKYMPFDARKYAPSRILGAGGFGVTFLCRHRELNDFVAVKALIAEELELDADEVFSEGRLLRMIDHPAIIRMQDCGFADPDAKARPFLVMDFFEGRTLEAHVAANGILSMEEGVALAKLLAEGMEAAHGRSVLHRDLKPANVMVRKEAGGWKAKIIDFGLALKRETVVAAAGVSTSQRNRTLAGSSIAGTVDYAAPEQMGKLPGVPVGPYSDVFSWARTLCYALFKTPTPGSRHYKSRETPDSLKVLLEECLDEEPPHRPQTFSEVLSRLGRVEEESNPALELVEEEAAAPATVRWHYARTGQQYGPVAEAELKSMLVAGTVGPDDVVWRDGMAAWTPAKNVEGLVPKAAKTGVRVRFFCITNMMEGNPALIIFKSLTASFTGGPSEQKIATRWRFETMKVYINGKLRHEGILPSGFDIRFETGLGPCHLEVARWNNNAEQERKSFELQLRKQGDHEVTFHIVETKRPWGNHMQNSTIELLKEPE